MRYQVKPPGWLLAAALIAGVVGALALAAFAVPATLAYDAWAWLGWAREIIHLDLNTTGGPSWKPLPVIIALPLTLAGDIAPMLWLEVSRAFGLLAGVAAYRLTRRITGSHLAPAWSVASGVLAAGLLILTPDTGPRFTRLLLEGHSAPWTAAMALGAIERHLAGRPRQAYMILALLSLDRPEAWPFLLAYGAWLILRHRPHWRFVASTIALLATLWFGVDWWGSGSPFHGADIAQVWGEGAVPFARAWQAFLQMVPIPVWLLAAVALVRATRKWRADPTGLRFPPTIVNLIAAALAWSAIVLAMNLFFGFAGISRFYLPAAAIITVVAAAEVTSFVATRSGLVRAAALAVAVILAIPAGFRASHLDGVVAEVTVRSQWIDQLETAIARMGGPAEVLRCDPVAIDVFDAPRPALAWHLGLPLGQVRLVKEPAGTGTFFVAVGGTAAHSLPGDPLARLVVSSSQWDVYRRACPS